MIDNFLEWFIERIGDIFDVLRVAIVKSADVLITIVSAVILSIFIIITLPIWLLPFIYWYFFVRNKDKTEDDE